MYLSGNHTVYSTIDFKHTTLKRVRLLYEYFHYITDKTFVVVKE